MTTQFIHDLQVEIEGVGPPLLFIHGLGGTSNTITPQVSALAARYQVIRPDLPGAGRTGMLGSPSLREIAARMLTLLAELKHSKVGLIGHSMGTVVCQYLAEEGRDLVSRMVLLGRR